MITLPTRDEIKTNLLAALSGLLPDLDPSPDSDAGARVEALTDAIYGLYCELYAVEQDVFPQTAEEEALISHAEARLGPSPRRAATKSQGTFKVHGEVAAVADIGEIIVHSDGMRFQLTEQAIIPGDGYIEVDIESIDTGVDANKATDVELTFEEPPDGIEAVGEVVTECTGGLDEETDDELRVRVLYALQNPPAGGRFSDYWSWALSVTGVAQAYVYGPSSLAQSGRRGLGVVDVAILAHGSGSSRIPSASLVSDVQDKIDEERPATTKDATVLTPAAVTQAFNVQIVPEVGYEFDWTTASSFTVSSYEVVGGEPKLTWNTTVPSTVNEGSRLWCNGELMTVASRSGSYTILEAEPAATPSGNIYPAGPLSEPVAEAIQDYVDTLGPARGDAYDPNQVWDDSIRIAKLYDVIMDVPGVRDVTVVTPATNITPTDHAPSGTVDLLVTGLITVRPE